MFAIPFNFVEDFFIVTDLASSLRRDGRTSVPASRRWLIVGLGWCILQIGSLLPGVVGITAGGLALPVWAWHWIDTGLIRRRIASSPAMRD